MGVSETLASIAQTLQTERPWSRLSNTVYLDAQAVVQWERLGVLEKVLDVVPANHATPRFELQHVAFVEASNRLASVIVGYSREDWEEYLRDGLPNLRVDDPIPAGTQLFNRVLAVRMQVAIAGARRRGLPPSTGPTNEHLGEAEALARIEAVDRGSVFVSADRDAVAVAITRGFAVPAHPLAFTVAALSSESEVRAMWRFECEDRGCGDKDVRAACQSAMECRHLTREAARRGELDDRFASADGVLDFGHRELINLVRRLPRLPGGAC